MSAAPDIGGIQAIVDRGFASLTGARYLLLRVVDAAAARAWLRSLPVTSLADAERDRLPRVRQMAFTAAGLKALGFDPEAVPGFAPEFLDGMAGDPSRSRRLGDVGPNDPAGWRWGAGDRDPHILVILLAGDDDIAAFEADTLAKMPEGLCTLIQSGPSRQSVSREPFGFVDGVSQPEPDWEGCLVPGGAKDRLYRNRIALGEFLLGHSNEYGFVTDYPQADGVGYNGSYLVYRQLVQDVTGFWRWAAAAVGEGSAVALAEQMVGRGIDGDPLPGLPHGAVEGESDTRNDFTYAADPDGRACPIGSHVRRANPRSSDDPGGRRGFVRDLISTLGLSGTAMHDAVASARFHRILRRGRTFGTGITPEEAMRGVQPAEETGLHFICLNANLARQFEFVQGAWLSSPYFAGLSGEQDPMLGNRCPVAGGYGTDAFSHCDADGAPRLRAGLPAFVRLVGGAYFFLPSIEALQFILRN